MGEYIDATFPLALLTYARQDVREVGALVLAKASQRGTEDGMVCGS